MLFFHVVFFGNANTRSDTCSSLRNLSVQTGTGGTPPARLQQADFQQATALHVSDKHHAGILSCHDKI